MISGQQLEIDVGKVMAKHPFVMLHAVLALALHDYQCKDVHHPA